MASDRLFISEDTKEKLKILKSIKKLSLEKRRKVLIDAGIMNYKGELTARYR